MADTRLTPIGIRRAVKLSCLTIFRPERMPAEQKKDDKRRKCLSPLAPKQQNRAFVVRRAFWMSLVLVTCSVAAGLLLGRLILCILGSPSARLVTWLQVIGASLLLWGTLFVRGWDIGTICGVTLVERVNQWIYRVLYCLGTSFAASSFALQW